MSRSSKHKLPFTTFFAGVVALAMSHRGVVYVMADEFELPQLTVPQTDDPVPSSPLADHLPVMVSEDARLHRLRELFGELQHRLELRSEIEEREVSIPEAIPVLEPVCPPEQDEPPLPAEADPNIETEPVEVVLPVEEPIPPAVLLPEQLSEEVISRLGLADSLFAAGEIQMALDVYAAIDLKSESEVERYWIILQMAACCRRLGDMTQAAKLYRQVVSVTEPAWMGDIARWWLKALDTRTTLEQQTSELDLTIEQLKETLNAELGS